MRLRRVSIADVRATIARLNAKVAVGFQGTLDLERVRAGAYRVVQRRVSESSTKIGRDCHLSPELSPTQLHLWLAGLEAGAETKYDLLQDTGSIR